MSAERTGFFIPYRHAAAIRPCGYPALEPLFVAAEPAMLAELTRAEDHVDRFLAMIGPPPLPRFDQEWFARLDAVAAYALVRRIKPARIIEIGGGHSSRFMARAIADGGLASDFLCIDPQPRADIEALPLRHWPLRIEEVDLAELARTLDAGDVLFVDSSHLLIPGGDVDRIVNDLLPRLPAGVHVHFHDIFLPDPYPDAWAWRGYAEQSVVAALLHSRAWAIMWSSHWLATRQAERIRRSPLHRLALGDGVPECSLWLTRSR